MRTNSSPIVTFVCLIAVIGGAIGAVAMMGDTSAAGRSRPTHRAPVTERVSASTEAYYVGTAR